MIPLQELMQRFYWVGCRQSVAVWIVNRAECIAANGLKSRSHGRMTRYNSLVPLERIAMDVAVPFPTSRLEIKYLRHSSNELFQQEAKTVATVKEKAKQYMHIFLPFAHPTIRTSLMTLYTFTYIHANFRSVVQPFRNHYEKSPYIQFGLYLIRIRLKTQRFSQRSSMFAHCS